MANNSFERGICLNGFAEDWDVTVQDSRTEVAAFDKRVCVTEPYENYEQFWRMPYIVHLITDADNVISAADASDLATALILATEMILDYNGHLSKEENVHISSDLLNLVSQIPPTDLTELQVVVNNIKAGYANHVINWPDAHGREDTLNLVTAPDASDLSTSVALVNDIKANFNVHITQLGIGKENDESKFALADADIEAGAVQDKDVEAYERLWAIADMWPTPIDQAVLVSVDGPNAVSWPTGHEAFLDDLDNTLTEDALPQGENYEQSWLLPGAIAVFPNQKLVERFLDETDGKFKFADNRLQIGIEETYEAGWRDNDVGTSKYWTGSEWAFAPADLETGIEETYESGWILTFE